MRECDSCISGRTIGIQSNQSCVHPFVARDDHSRFRAFDFCSLVSRFAISTGNNDEAFRLLGDSTAALPAVMKIDPLFEGLRADRRFSASTR